MKNFSKESIEQAIKSIDHNPDLIVGRESKDYDIILENGNVYPPILVLSEANKILGGDALVIHDFRNNTRVPFKILRDFGYKIVRKDATTIAVIQEPFEYSQFTSSCKKSNFVITSQLAVQFIAALITKPFVILTGLSGSGKTQLALALAKWLTNSQSYSLRDQFTKNEKIKSSQKTFLIVDSDRIAVTFLQEETGTKVTLPYELLDEWIDIIKENDFSQKTPIKTIRAAVNKKTKFSTQLNSFETHLTAAAFNLINRSNFNSAKLGFQYLLVPVGADWTNREPLLGFPNAIQNDKYEIPESGVLKLLISANENPEIPHFLILDEMNLSHVERYFADFLSAMESNSVIRLHSGENKWNGIPPSISLSSNLFIIGTVNIDETTYMFSPKVLDRANVIEFRVSAEEMSDYLLQSSTLDLKKLQGNGSGMGASFVELAQKRDLVVKDQQKLHKVLMEFFDQLKLVGAEFGYRTAAEILRFAGIVNIIEPEWSIDQILDAAIIQKLLPKIHGSKRKLDKVMKSLGDLTLQSEHNFEQVFEKRFTLDFGDSSIVKYPISLEKIIRMYDNLLKNSFTSFAEA